MLGPVFHAELLTTARRARYYAIRAIYVMAILCVLWSAYESAFHFESGATSYPVSTMTQFAIQTFRTFALTQAITVLALTPALVAGTIATEKQRKTLHYLLASQLTSGEIVFGKLAARLLHVAVFLALGVPIFSLLTLFGSVDYWLILGVYGATCSGVFFLAAISIFASVQARRAREAVFLAYSLIVVWVVLPFIFSALCALLAPTAWEWVWPLEFALYPGLGLAYRTMSPELPIFSSVPAWCIFTWSLGYLNLWGVLLIWIATRRLRPLTARQENKPRLVIGLDNKGRRQYRVLPRPACFQNDPMLWKERYVSRLGGLARLLTSFAGIFLLTLIGCIAFEVIKDSVREMWTGGFFPVNLSKGRQEMNAFVRSVNASVFCLWMLCTAASAAASISGEREEDTWISLTSTSLTGREILRAKLWGAILRFKILGYTMAVLTFLALVTGAVHPIGVVATTVVCAVLLYFTASLGTYCSLRSKTTLRALSLTILPLIFLNGAYFFCCVPLPRGGLVDFADAAIPARQAWASFYSYQDFAMLSSDWETAPRPGAFSQNYDAWSTPQWADQLRWFLAFYAVIVPLYALAGWLIARRALLWFPRAAGRAQRPGAPRGTDDDQDDRPMVKIDAKPTDALVHDLR